MPLLFFILVVILIAQIGFWNTLGAILGAAAMMVLLRRASSSRSCVVGGAASSPSG